MAVFVALYQHFLWKRLGNEFRFQNGNHIQSGKFLSHQD